MCIRDSLDTALLNAIMDELSTHTIMSKQALESKKTQQGILNLLLGPLQLYEALRSHPEGESKID